jgi:hypothetical protein
MMPFAKSETIYTPADCFSRSLQFFTEMGSKREQAMVMWQWASYELAQGDKTQGELLWQGATEIFLQLNLPLLVDQMENQKAGK